ncbi:MAG TPA: hypothetical protein VNG90_02895 [Candidatus Acidoferrum sp.]|nr:hypothetical protein [Candidatus Acidoferrum sp.]
MLPVWFLNIAIVIRLLGGAGYVVAVLRGKAKPNPVTWFFWGLTPMLAFAAQVSEGVGPQACVTFALGIGPLAVFCLSLTRGHHAPMSFAPSTIACGILAALGIVLWQTTSDPTLAIVFSILADIAASVPTLMKAYHKPGTEYGLTYLLSMISMVITLLTITHWTFGRYAFPIYIFFINLSLFSLVQSKVGARRWYRPGIKKSKLTSARLKTKRLVRA